MSLDPEFSRRNFLEKCLAFGETWALTSAQRLFNDQKGVQVAEEAVARITISLEDVTLADSVITPEQLPPLEVGFGPVELFPLTEADGSVGLGLITNIDGALTITKLTLNGEIDPDNIIPIQSLPDEINRVLTLDFAKEDGVITLPAVGSEAWPEIRRIDVFGEISQTPLAYGTLGRIERATFTPEDPYYDERPDDIKVVTFTNLEGNSEVLSLNVLDKVVDRETFPNFGSPIAEFVTFPGNSREAVGWHYSTDVDGIPRLAKITVPVGGNGIVVDNKPNITIVGNSACNEEEIGDILSVSGALEQWYPKQWREKEKMGERAFFATLRDCPDSGAKAVFVDTIRRKWRGSGSLQPGWSTGRFRVNIPPENLEGNLNITIAATQVRQERNRGPVYHHQLVLLVHSKDTGLATPYKVPTISPPIFDQA